jgi:hypothetical protein
VFEGPVSRRYSKALSYQSARLVAVAPAFRDTGPSQRRSCPSFKLAGRQMRITPFLYQWHRIRRPLLVHPGSVAAMTPFRGVHGRDSIRRELGRANQESEAAADAV